MRVMVASRFFFESSHSPTAMTVLARVSRRWALSSSQAMLRATFSRQNCSLVLGTVYLVQPRWPCQKQPLMKMSARYGASYRISDAQNLHFIGIRIFFYLCINHLGNVMIEERIILQVLAEGRHQQQSVVGCRRQQNRSADRRAVHSSDPVKSLTAKAPGFNGSKAYTENPGSQ